ncbi:MAG TPA: heme-copper oxidase subunit III [Candidatus Polarisedimenticolaceae bacterium]|nr:heme-copper oxidase subunit III [Candidatus Polarisedimenticolaceae bacterium]
MWIFLGALGMLFAASIAGFLVVRLKAEAWPPPGMPRLPNGLWITTAILLAGSFTIQRALVSIRLGQIRNSARWLTTTLILGVLFLVSQMANWWGLVTAQMTATTKNLYAFTFYMLTGLHAAHVSGGLILLAVVLSRTRRDRYGSGHHDGITYAVMYWHFLGVVWCVLFGVLLIFA